MFIKNQFTRDTNEKNAKNCRIVLKRKYTFYIKFDILQASKLEYNVEIIKSHVQLKKGKCTIALNRLC